MSISQSCQCECSGSAPSPSPRLRLIVKTGSLPQERPKACFNDTLVEASLAAWKGRLEAKLHFPVHLRFAPLPEQPALPLETEEDLMQLRACYEAALLAQNERPSTTLRLLVLVQPVQAVDCTTTAAAVLTASPAGAVPRSRQQRQGSQPSATEASPRPSSQHAEAAAAAPTKDVAADAGRTPQQPEVVEQRNSPSPAQLRANKKARSDHVAWLTPTPSKHSGVISEQDICWANVLRSIVKTVDTHHFGSKLAAAAARSEA